MRRKTLLHFFVVCTLFAGGAHSEPATSLARLVKELRSQLPPVPTSLLVVSTLPEGDIPLTRPEALAARMASLVAASFPQAKALSPARSRESARSAATGYSHVLVLSARIRSGRLELIGDLSKVEPNSWDRVRNLPSPPLGHAVANTYIDGEIRAFLPPIPLESGKLSVLAHDEPDVYAIGCSDLDQDGGLELVLVSERGLTFGKMGGGHLLPQLRKSWSELAPRVPMPLREPIGQIQTLDRGAIIVSTTQTGSMTLGERAETIPHGATFLLRGTEFCSTPDPRRGALAEFSPCAAPKEAAAVSVIAFDAYTHAFVTQANGHGHLFEAMRVLSPGAKPVLLLRRDGVEIARLSSGAQIALGDLDQDGSPELVTSADASEDVLTIYSLHGTELQVRKEIPAPAGIRALSICPPEAGAIPPLVAAVGNGVWIVR